MNWRQRMLAKAREERASLHVGRRDSDAHEGDLISEIQPQQPFSDGSEEFFGDFMPREETKRLSSKQVMIGLGLTAGVLAGVGIAMWLKKTKHDKPWWQRWLHNSN
ncbi:MAG: hypothetical protein ONA90_10010 [candidate division KSB1 bacterium]|nr:hypothetical protein [candidate division KSB1 bacterium]